MAYFRKRNGNWSATVERTGHKPLSKTFPTKTLAQEWARSIEQSIDAVKFSDDRVGGAIPFRVLVDQYVEEFDNESFGRTKGNSLKMTKAKIGGVNVGDLTGDRWLEFVKGRTAEGAGGVTVSLDLTYAKQVLTTAKYLWKMPTKPEAIDECRVLMKYAGIKTRSKHRDRRPTEVELKKIYDRFDGTRDTVVSIPHNDIIQFAIASCMRQEEITRIRWDDLNEKDKTVFIRDRKDPEEKIGNDQEVPLLGEAFDIVMRQPRKDECIFPYRSRSISSWFTRSCTELKIKDLRFHDLRHEGISRLFEQGYRIEQVALVSGHKSWENLKRYTQLKAKDLHRD